MVVATARRRALTPGGCSSCCLLPPLLVEIWRSCCAPPRRQPASPPPGRWWSVAIDHLSSSIPPPQPSSCCSCCGCSDGRLPADLRFLLFSADGCPYGVGPRWTAATTHGQPSHHHRPAGSSARAAVADGAFLLLFSTVGALLLQQNGKRGWGIHRLGGSAGRNRQLTQKRAHNAKALSEMSRRSVGIGSHRASSAALATAAFST